MSDYGNIMAEEPEGSAPLSHIRSRRRRADIPFFERSCGESHVRSRKEFRRRRLEARIDGARAGGNRAGGTAATAGGGAAPGRLVLRSFRLQPSWVQQQSLRDRDRGQELPLQFRVQ